MQHYLALLKKTFKLDNVFVLISSFLIFIFIGHYIGSDLSQHSRQIIKINNSEVAYPSNFLYYFLLNLFSGFSKNSLTLLISGVTLLSFSTTLKYIVTKRIIKESLLFSNIKITKLLLITVAVSLLFFLQFQTIIIW